MDLNKTGKLLGDSRKAKGLTQKQVAEKLGVLPKTVSKWETGHGFPDVSALSALADVLGVSERILLSGKLVSNRENAGNIKKTKFLVCHDCGSFMQVCGECQTVCCGRVLEPLKPQPVDDNHIISVSQVENDFYIEFNHEMTKEHFISFVAFVGYDRMLTVRLYPEQSATVRFPKMYRGKLYFYCNNHGLFEYKI